MGLEIYFSFKLNLKNFDQAALLIMLEFTLCLILKAASILIIPNMNVNDDYASKAVALFTLVTDIIIWALIFFFLFEM